MTLTISWWNIALRVLLTVIASLIIGANRSQRGRAAGLRTNVLVGLAACLAMLQATLLLPTAGKAPSSFITLDLMRLPLGILSGMGFIGAGTIVRNKNRIQGVTTAASLWFLTVVGLCFGGGQLALGSAGTAIGFAALAGLRPWERSFKIKRHAKLTVELTGQIEDMNQFLNAVSGGRFQIQLRSFAENARKERRQFVYKVSWREAKGEYSMPAFVTELARSEGIAQVYWNARYF